VPQMNPMSGGRHRGRDVSCGRHSEPPGSRNPDQPGEDRAVGYRSLLAVGGYPSLLGAQAVSRVGDSVHYVALVALIFSLTGSGLAVSIAVVFEAVPVLLFGAVAGALVDRHPRRGVMVTADLARCGLALVMTQTTAIPAIYALAFGLALAGVFYGPAYQSLLPAVVPARVLGRANALSWSTVQSSHVLGAALGGAAVAVTGAAGAFALNAATFLISALLLLRVREPVSAITAARTTRLRTETRQGIEVIRADAFIRRLLGVQVLAVLSVGGTGALLVVLATEQLGVDESDFGLLVAALGVGAFLGPLLFGRLVDRLDSPVLVFLPYLVRGLIDAALAFVTGFWVPAALLLLYGINTSTGGVAYTTLLQRRIPADYRGRVFSAFNMVWQGGRLASLTLAGLVVDVLSIQVLYIGAGALLVLAGLVGVHAMRQASPSATPKSTPSGHRDPPASTASP
jgi:MFS family permease